MKQFLKNNKNLYLPYVFWYTYHQRQLCPIYAKQKGNLMNYERSNKMIYTQEVENMCPVAQGVHHGAAPIPEEAKWVQAKEVKDISGFTHGIGWCAPQQGACKLSLNVKNGVIQEALVETIGCSGMTHSAAMAAEILPGLTVMEALNTDLVCDAINTAMRELFLQIVYGRTQSAFSEGGLAVGAGLEDPLVSGERFVLNGGNYTYQELFTAIARVNGVQPPWWNLAPWMTELVWRMLACWGYLSGSKPAFTRETARSSQHCSRYSNARILSLYPDFHFYPLVETVDHMRLMWISASADPKHK